MKHEIALLGMAESRRNHMGAAVGSSTRRPSLGGSRRRLSAWMVVTLRRGSVSASSREERGVLVAANSRKARLAPSPLALKARRVETC